MHPTRYPQIYAPHGGVSAAHPLAAASGLAMLRGGGNAVDAAIAAAAVMGVALPAMNGLGGDAFMLMYDAASGSTHALNGSGPAPRGLDPAAFASGLPLRDPRRICVPGAVGLWGVALERFGTRPFADVLQDAIALADGGFVIDSIMADAFNSDGAAVRSGTLGRQLEGDLLRQPELARTLRKLAIGGADAFYTGEVALAIARTVRTSGGWLHESDLAAYVAEWKTPYRLKYRDYDIVEQPLVSQGVLLLAELQLMEHMGVQQRAFDDPELVHRMLSAVRLARADRDALLGDPDFRAIDVSVIVDPDRAGRRAAQVTDAALQTRHSISAGQDTAGLVVVDAHGNCVCLIQSLFHAFGSGLMVDGTGVLLNNRGAGFSEWLDAPNAPAPGKRPLHTLHSCMLLRDGCPSVLLSTPGGDGQVQTHLQVLHAYIHSGLTLQAAIELPRWFDDPATGRVLMESRFDTHVVDDLRARGYDVEVLPEWSPTLGGFQGATRGDSGWWLAADPRQDCWAIGY